MNISLIIGLSESLYINTKNSLTHSGTRQGSILHSKIVSLSNITKNSRALREEIDYGLNVKGLPVIVIYPDFKEKSDIRCSTGIRKQVKDLWDELPIFRDNMDKVATVHVPYKKELITSALNNTKFEVQTMTNASIYSFL